MWTNYVIDSPGMVTVFEAGNCENCDGVVQEANAVGMSQRDAERLGLERVARLPAEIYYCEELGHTNCEHCA